MKTFIGTVITLIIITALVITNSMYISRLSDEMITIAKGMPEETTDSSLKSALELQKKLDDSEFILLLTVNHNEIEMIDLRITEIISRIENGDKENYSFAVKALITELEELRKSEKLSWDAIV